MQTSRVLTVLTLTLALLVPPGIAWGQSDDADLVLFWGDGCPHCAAEHQFLEELQVEFPDLVIAEYEVYNDDGNRELFFDTMLALGQEPRAVPTTIIDGQVWVGFGDATGPQLEAAVAALLASRATEPMEPVVDPQAESLVHLPLIGDVDVAHQSLLVSTLVIGFVDGFNPCSLWVLSILLALVLHTGSRRRVFAVGATFLVVTTMLYALYIVGLYSVLSYVSYVGWIRVGVALIALVFGLINLKDYFAAGRGPSLSIPDARKPGIYGRARAVAAADRPLPAVLGGTAAMAVGVSLIETPCTAGFPVLWTNLLADQGVALAPAAALFGVYMAVFLLDELAILGMAVVGMRAAKLQEQHGRLLKLAGGTVMVTLASVLVWAPEMMESVPGAMAVFVIAAGVTLLVVVAERVFRRRTPGISDRSKEQRRAVGSRR